MNKLKKGMTVFYNRTNGETVTGTIVKHTRNNATYIKRNDNTGRIIAAPSGRVFPMKETAAAVLCRSWFDWEAEADDDADAPAFGD